MSLPLWVVACGLAVGPAGDVPAGRERPAEDHEYYRPVGAVRHEPPATAPADRLAPTADWVGWVRRWAAGVVPLLP
jgi:hypothetical protein